MLQVFHILSYAEYKPRRGFANIQDASVLLKYQSIVTFLGPSYTLHNYDPI